MGEEESTDELTGDDDGGREIYSLGASFFFEVLLNGVLHWVCVARPVSSRPCSCYIFFLASYFLVSFSRSFKTQLSTLNPPKNPSKSYSRS